MGLGLGKLFPAMESLVSDIPAGDRNTAKPFFTVYLAYLILLKMSGIIFQFKLSLYVKKQTFNFKTVDFVCSALSVFSPKIFNSA